MTLALRYAARSDRGLVRANNEDSVYAGARLLALADGMGGHAAGEVASQLVIAALAHLDDDEPGGDLLGKLERSVYEGNSAIAEQVELHPDLDGMGTTLTAILFAGDRLGMVHIGDSRAYLLRDGELTQITKDDTFVQTLVDEGRITAEEAHTHPQRSLIMRALTGQEVEPTLIMREAREGDRYLLCSDGLSDPVRQDTILEALKIPDVADSADRLIELALRGGGPDNVTVIVADVVDHDYGGQTQPIIAGAVSGDDDHRIAPPNTSAGRASVIAPRPPAPKRAVPEPEPPPVKSRRRTIVAAALVLLLLIAGIGLGYRIIRGYYYVGAHDDRVAIMRGIQGSVLGVPLQQPYQLGCINDRGELSQISYGQADTALGCELMRLQDLRPSERAQVSAGLPAGSLDDAIGQLRELAQGSLLPQCAPAPVTPPPSAAPRSGSGAPAAPPTSTSASPSAPASPTASPTTATTSGATPAPPAPTTTALPAPPQKPGVDCRAAA
ncbi:protein phosphatase 2C domain-containing protein [Mycolicibacterium sp.]|uniref:PP2C family protein-serine/threonine phosphatase n=1 Tax=Mycolicibacterium sp. TaxID=2320850 RepID=UPI0028AEE079|nr:protein phosphatase 2C domain-containing protein [Mycolicibacterium sp.]